MEGMYMRKNKINDMIELQEMLIKMIQKCESIIEKCEHIEDVIEDSGLENIEEDTNNAEDL
jgi:hypothetical protein